MSTARKILFIIYKLGGGGAERSLKNLLASLNRELFVPEVVTFRQDISSDYDMPQNVQITNLNYRRTYAPGAIYSLSKIIHKTGPDIIVSSLSLNSYSVIISKLIAMSRAPLFIIDHVNTSNMLKQRNFLVKRIHKMLIRSLHGMAEGFLPVSRGVMQDLCENYGMPESKCVVIYNPLDIDEIASKASEEVDHPWFSEDVPIVISCGRLTEQKNYPLLLKSMKRVLKKTHTRLVIVGSGEEKKSLERLAKELRIENYVYFAGFQKNPFKYIARSQVFVLSSFFEGFGNVICEAMACGTPVISTRCPSGPDEIITNGVDGLLVPVGDTGAMAEAILRVLEDKVLRKSLAEAGRGRAEDFRSEKIVAEYEKVFLGEVPRR